MGEEFSDKDDLKKLFESILGSNINIKDTMVINDESIFCLIVNKLDKAHKDDEALYELSGMDLSRCKEDLLFVIEALLKISYGQDAFDMIMWYILDRFNPDGKVVPFEDENGKQFSLITSKDLYAFVKHRFPK
tara:strand:- start:4045 stop:4443 length:399 start_codon:yes stop_codon:yes gene_type:complete